MRLRKSILFLVEVILIAAWIIPSASMAKPHKPKNPKVNWKDIIGLIEPGNVVGSGTGQVTGGSEPWSASNGEVKLDLITGEIEFHVKGLVFAGGKFIGTPGQVTQVIGTLVCNATGEISINGGNSVLIDTPSVRLDDDGDAEFHGEVTLNPACSNGDIAFLIRIPSSGLWIANGAVRSIQQP